MKRSFVFVLRGFFLLSEDEAREAVNITISGPLKVTDLLTILRRTRGLFTSDLKGLLHASIVYFLHALRYQHSRATRTRFVAYLR